MWNVNRFRVKIMVVIFMGLLFTLITGAFFLLGIYLNKLCKNHKNISVLSISLAFTVLLSLIGLDILPEVFSDFSYWNITFILLGMILLKLMDLFVPHHTHHHKEKKDNIKEHNNHLEHISIITVLSLTLHNVIECMALYNLTISNIKSGLLMCLAIGLHNIPLGFQIGDSLKKHRNLYVGVLTTSGLLGGVISLLVGEMPEIYTVYILCFTLGMLIYLTFFELLKELVTSLKNVYTLYGIILGIVFVIATSLF